MQENFRQFLDRLRQTGDLVDLHQPVDIRHIATLVDQAKTALYFHNVIGYDMPVVSGIIRSRERAMMALGCETYREIEDKLKEAIERPIPPKYLKTSPTRETVLLGDDVDLYKLPIPMSSIYDGGPMITAGVVIARDPELGVNSGIYRFIVKEKALTGIDIVTPNNMRLFVQRALERKEPLPISISIGVHPIEITGSGYRAPLGVDEMAIAGGIRGEAVQLAPCQTVDVPYIADAEIVLEAEVLPTGWTWPEGRFGEFTRLMGGLHWNPLVRIKAISMRKDAVYYNLHMPWENTWLAAPTRYTAIRTALRTANVQVKDINVTLGGCAFWHAVISIKKGAGEGKNALLAALSVMDLKHVVVVDDDIDINDPTDVEWAIATRVQGDKDVIIVPGARAKPLDPSLLQGAGVVPIGTKVGVDATFRSSTMSASLMPTPIRRKSTITSAARRTRLARVAMTRRLRCWRRRSWTLSPSSRCTSPTLRKNSRTTISIPLHALSAICTPRKSSGRTRADDCACAARNLLRSCRRSNGDGPVEAHDEITSFSRCCGRRQLRVACARRGQLSEPADPPHCRFWRRWPDRYSSPLHCRQTWQRAWRACCRPEQTGGWRHCRHPRRAGAAA
jgi:2,5-furandicarboxylate decarboxylase 1